MDIDVEKRRSYRIQINKNLFYKLYNEFNDNSKNKALYDGCCIDISQGGICILTGFYLKKGDIIKLLIPINSLNLTNTIIAKVIWTRYEKGCYRTGLEFIRK